MNAVAEGYVKLVLAVGQHDPAYVDAYYGPEDWQGAAAQQVRSLADLDRDASCLIIEAGAQAPTDALDKRRQDYLLGQLRAVRARIAILSGTTLSFDEESSALYDAVAPTWPDAHFQEILDDLEGCLPGAGMLSERYEAFRQAFVIPKDRLAPVFDRAIAECRARTKRHVLLPAEEHFVLEYVTQKSWSGYNWYQGHFHSLIQVNTDLPIYIDRAVDLACHEGYPGHHAYNVLLEKALVRDRGWLELTVYPLFSPQSLIAEGTANFGIEVTFPGSERLRFERDVLFPAAGLDAAHVEQYYAVQTMVQRLSYAGNEAARRYLNGQCDRAAAAAWLTRYALMSPPRAEQRVRFMDDYRSYVINYNLGQDLVKRYVESRGGVATASARRWEVFTELLTTPRLPSSLQ